MKGRMRGGGGAAVSEFSSPMNPKIIIIKRILGGRGLELVSFF